MKPNAPANRSGSLSTLPPRSRLTACIDLFMSMRFGLVVMLVLALACIVGTLLPQGAEVNNYLKAHPHAADRMRLFGTLGLTHIFTAWWFIGLISILGANLTTCIVRRVSTFGNTVGRERIRVTGTILVHLSLLVIFAGGVIRGLRAEKGHIEFHEGETVDSFVSDLGTPMPLPFKVRLKDFTIERHDDPADASPYVERLHLDWAERGIRAVIPVELNKESLVFPDGEGDESLQALRVTVLRHVTDFAIDMTTKEVTSRSAAFENPAILVRVTGRDCNLEQWVFARYPDFNMGGSGAHGSSSNPTILLSYQVLVQSKPVSDIKSFKSTLQFIEGNAMIAERSIEVNAPFYHQGYGFFQSGYSEQDPTWTSLQVVHDPSVPVIYTGFIMIIVGLIIVVNSRSGPVPATPHPKKGVVS